MTGPIADAASSGSEISTLIAMRDQLAASMDSSPGYAMARIATQLVRVLARITELRPEATPTLAEELDRRRAVREAGKPTADLPTSTDPKESNG